MRGRASIGRLYRARDVDGLVDAMREARFPRRLAIVAGLANIGTREAEAALLGALSDPNSFVRSTAVGSLARIDRDRDPLPVLQALRGDVAATHEPSVEEVMTAGLYQLRRLDTVPILIRGLRSDDDWTRAGSAEALAHLADRRAAAALADAQADASVHVRRAARRAFDKTVPARG